MLFVSLCGFESLLGVSFPLLFLKIWLCVSGAVTRGKSGGSSEFSVFVWECLYFALFFEGQDIEFSTDNCFRTLHMSSSHWLLVSIIWQRSTVNVIVVALFMIIIFLLLPSKFSLFGFRSLASMHLDVYLFCISPAWCLFSFLRA